MLSHARGHRGGQICLLVLVNHGHQGFVDDQFVVHASGVLELVHTLSAFVGNRIRDKLRVSARDD